MSIKKNRKKPEPDIQSPKSICVFCGASKVAAAHYFKLAKKTGKAIAKRNYRLVYGGGGIGLMGASAKAAMDRGGEVLGVIPEFLVEIEGLETDIPHRIVKDMRVRKHEMHKESDAYIVLPGGIGTLEEAIEVMSWMRLHLHSKPMIFVDTDGYWAPLMDLLAHTIDAKFSPRWLKAHLFRTDCPKAALDLIESHWKNPPATGNVQVTDDIDNV